MKKFSKSAFVALLALVCYAGFVSAQVVSFDNSGDFGSLVSELKAGNKPGFGGGHGNQNPHPSPFQPPHNGGSGQGNHNGPQPGPGNHNNPGHNNGPFNPGHNNPGHNDPGPWHPGPQPQPWNPGPQPGQWHPHHNGHPDWNNNDWNNNHWNSHGPSHNTWWGNYDWWWMNNNHPYSQYRTVCEVTPGVSAKGFIIEKTMPFYGKATFYYYDIFNNLITASNTASSVYSGGNGTPIFDFYQVPNRADRCFLSVTRN